MLIWFLSNHCILDLALNVSNQTTNSLVCMAKLLSSNGPNSGYFDNVYLKLSTNAYSEVRFHFTLSKYENSRNRLL